MSTLEQSLIEEITLNGPMRLDFFMDIAIRYYYSHSIAIGATGDFITAPEISQMFGEIIGIYFASCWLEEGMGEFSIIELGPGRATLMKDFLRGTKHIKGFHQSINKIYLLEQSTKMRSLQQENLIDYAEIVVHIDNLNDIDTKGKVYIIANEFFDCLPIRAQTIMEGMGYEIFIGYEDGKFHYLAISSDRSKTRQIKDLSIINVMEITDSYIPYVQGISKLLKQGGRALIIDYGYLDNAHKSTIQAIKKHKFHNVLEDIGFCDITSLVNFKALAELFHKEQISSRIETQGSFLLRNGIKERAAQLKSNAKDPSSIDTAINRLTGIEEMGELFKVLIVSSLPYQENSKCL